jgi:serine/threonine protein kinase
MAFHCLSCRAELEAAFRACPHCGEPVTDFLRRYREEPVDGKYRILQRLGTGGMGEVYKVEHTYLGAIRVIKVIRPQISESRDAHDRFLREARLATKVQHANVATLHDFSALPDGSHYMVWEFIDGENLAERIRRRGTLPPREAVHITIQALEGLDAIHRAGIVHRDISPENLMLTRGDDGSEHLKIIDLGVAKMDGTSEVATQTGIFVGKLRYASPEHLGFLPDGERIDGRADLYSMAIVLYEMLAGRPPFEATSPHQYLVLHSKETHFEPLHLPANLPGGEELQRVMRRALEHDRNKRYATAREWITALESVERALPPPFDAEATMRVTPAPAPLLGTETIAATQRAPFYTPSPRPTIAAPPTPSPRPTVAAPPNPVPVAPPPTVLAPPTIIEPLPPPKPWRSVATIAIVLFLAAGAMAIAYLRSKPAQVEAEPSPPAVTAAAIPPSQAATSTFEVLNTSTSSAVPATQSAGTTEAVTPPVTAMHTTATRTQAVEPPPAQLPHPSQEHTPAEPEPVSFPSGGHTYTEGGDGDANDAALEDLRRAVSGASTIGIVGGAMSDQLLRVLQKSASAVTFMQGNAEITIHFEGTLEHRGLGRKRRAAHATITKGGRTVFRYEMPPEDFRVGDDPVEAFARAISDSLR